jgi:hypothetical protein
MGVEVLEVAERVLKEIDGVVPKMVVGHRPAERWEEMLIEPNHMTLLWFKRRNSGLYPMSARDGLAVDPAGARTPIVYGQ